MKPQGILFELPDTNDARIALDDDYAWHVRQQMATRTTGRRADAAGRKPSVPRLVAFVRASLSGRPTDAIRRA